MSQSPEYVGKDASYADIFKPEDILPLVAEKVDLIVTCMDPRLDPHAQFGAKLGDTARSMMHFHRSTNGGMTRGIRLAAKKAYPREEAAKAVERAGLWRYTLDPMVTTPFSDTRLGEL
ncbi:hypothetical protein C8J56DRAFT_1043752 [Mycena floridula]|nr:hypothetical protein C8J56DRAFT_1043752 [Mycena floridula]